MINKRKFKKGARKMSWKWIETIILLPFNVLVIIPAAILYFTDYRFRLNNIYWLVIGVVLLGFGLFLAGWTMRLFAIKGKGTAAPWNPPKKLVIFGPYCYVRNPMITSVLVMLIAEALLLNSWYIFALFALFLCGNMMYFPLFEEKNLESRFGKDYLRYKQNVPRWIPRLTPWKK
ncbi:MAG: isoprenylcysteine carboxylmethyltransferase family protein [Holosporaceae bacterium]|jgi:protein-S-isoprenylcysteine O-methyltransferase Ste14|nr:isoprenylcysteine carboxylmethyltransferase family protein [Holosporaceae bacterium]